MKVNRLIEIIFILTERENVTARELAQRFNVSERTIYRDIDTLSSSTIPVYTERGVGGGIRILPEFVFNKALLSEEEQKNILIGLQSLKATGYPETEDIINKLNNIFNKEEYNWIEVDFTSWGNVEQDKKFSLLKDGILNKNLISFNYYNLKGEASERKVEPTKLIFKQNSWYLQGYCKDKKDFRLFKISRMQEISLLDESFKTNKTPPPIEINTMDKNIKLINAKLLFKDSFAYQVYDDFNQKHITQNENGLVVDIDLPDREWIFEMILSYGTNVKVLGDRDFYNKFMDYLNDINNLYK